MTMQTDLFVDVPLSRVRDPETSHLAAERIRKSGALGCQQAAVLAAVHQWPGMTAVELAHLAKMDRYAVSRRTAELAGVKIKRGPARACTVNGSQMTTWFAL